MKKALFGLAAIPVVVAGCAPAADTSSVSGTFEQRYEYDGNSGDEYLDVIASVQDGLITDIVVRAMEGNEESANYVAEFDANLKDDIVGKSLAEAKDMGRVSGASKPSFAFQYALKEIQKEAAATAAPAA